MRSRSSCASWSATSSTAGSDRRPDSTASVRASGDSEPHSSSSARATSGRSAREAAESIFATWTRVSSDLPDRPLSSADSNAASSDLPVSSASFERNASSAKAARTWSTFSTAARVGPDGRRRAGRSGALFSAPSPSASSVTGSGAGSGPEPGSGVVSGTLHAVASGSAGVSGSGAGAWGTSRPKPSSPLLLKSNPKAKVFPFRMSGIVAIDLCGLAVCVARRRGSGSEASCRKTKKPKQKRAIKKPGTKKDETRKTKSQRPRPDQTYLQNQTKNHTANRKYPKQKNEKQALKIFPAKENSNQQDRQPIHHNPTFASPEVADREKRGPRTGFSRLRAHRRTA